MLINPDKHLILTPPSHDKLAHAFLQMLAIKAVDEAEDGVRKRSVTASAERDAVEIAMGIDPTERMPAVASPRADRSAIAVLLARAIEQHPGLINQLRLGRSVVAVDVPSSELVDGVVEILDICATTPTLGGMKNPVMVSSRRCGYVVFTPGDDGNYAIRPEVLTWSLGIDCPILVVTVRGDERSLPRALSQRIEYRVSLPVLDNAALALVVNVVCSQAPTIELTDDTLRQIEISDLASAIRSGRDADACIRAIEQAIQGRLKPQAEGPKVQDLIGFGSAKGWALDLIDDIGALKAGSLTWADFSNRALLLSGKPGLGKTSFARALSRSADVPLIATSVAEWHSQNHLSGALAMIRSVFDRARECAPAIVFIDELDGISSRAAPTGQHEQYWQQVINYLLQQLDGFEEREGVIIIAATNYPELVDAALLRAGRLDRHIEIQLPDINELAEIIGFYAGPSFQGDGAKSLAVAALGSTGADIEACVRRAKARARREKRPLCEADIMSEIDGHRPAPSPEARRRICVHEAGHAVAAMALGTAEIEMLSVNNKGGEARFAPKEGVVMTERACMDRLAVMLAGRAAEEIVFGDISADSAGDRSSDLARATELALVMEMQLGFGDWGALGLPLDLSNALAVPGVLPAMRRRLDDAMALASSVLLAHRTLVDSLSGQLFRCGLVSAADFDRLRGTVSGRLPN